MKKTLALLALILISTSCNPNVSTNSQKPAPSQRTLVFKEEASGGLCTNGGCFSQTLVYSDGSYKAKNNNSDKSGSVNKDLITALQNQIQKTDFALLSSVPFTGTCPSAYDGSEIAYTFYNSSGQATTLDSCKEKIDMTASIFKAVAGIQKEIQ